MKFIIANIFSIINQKNEILKNDFKIIQFKTSIINNIFVKFSTNDTIVNKISIEFIKNISIISKYFYIVIDNFYFNNFFSRNFSYTIHSNFINNKHFFIFFSITKNMC